MISGRRLLVTVLFLVCVGSAGTALAQGASSTTRFAAGFSRVTTTHSLDVPDSQLATPIHEWTLRANAGDAHAAALLATALMGCTARKSMPNPAIWMAHCDGVTDEQLSQAAHWMDVAAQEGDKDAQYAYSAGSSDVVVGVQGAQNNPVAFAAFKAKSQNYLLTLAQECNYDAIATIASNGADDGLIFGDDPATAYKFARVQALLESPSTKVQSNSAMYVAKLKRRLDAAKIAAPSDTEVTAFADHYCR